MKLPDIYLKKLKWSIYEWLGTISIEEISSNERLDQLTTTLSKTLRFVHAALGESANESRAAC